MTAAVEPLGEEGFGGAAHFYAQTFVMPETGDAVSVTFLMRGASHLHDEAAKFHVLLATVAGSGTALHPGEIIFESSSVTAPNDPDVFEPVTISLDQTRLVGGMTYFVILETCSTADGISGSAQVAATTNYAGGEFYAGGAEVSACLIDAIAARQQNFNDPTHFFPPFANFDLVFSLMYQPVNRKPHKNRP